MPEKSLLYDENCKTSRICCPCSSDNLSYIIVSYRVNSTSNYDSQVATFDSAVGNLQIANILQAPAIPEFPVIAIGIIVAIMVGAVVVLGRIRPIQRV